MRAVALPQTAPWLAVGSDWHVSFFSWSRDLTGSWSSCSADLLLQWSVADWPRHKHYIYEALAVACLPSWRARIQKHRSYVSYDCFDQMPCLVMKRGQGDCLSSKGSIELRSWLRLRCGLIDLSTRRAGAMLQGFRSVLGVALLSETLWCTACLRARGGPHSVALFVVALDVRSSRTYRPSR